MASKTRVPSAMEVAMRSSVSFGQEKTYYGSSSKDIYVPVDRKTFMNARGGARDMVAELTKTHFVLGDVPSNYTTTNKMRLQNGRRGDESKSGIGDLLVSNLSLGQEKTNYTTSSVDQYHSFGREAMAKPSRDIAIKLMAGSKLKLGDEKPMYISESKGKFIPESSMMAVKRKKKAPKDPLAQNGRAAPLSSISIGRYQGKWESGSIGAMASPLDHVEYTPYEGCQSTKVDAYKSNMVLGDEILNYQSTSGESQEYLGEEKDWNTKLI
jgi:hypothetical protein